MTVPKRDYFFYRIMLNIYFLLFVLVYRTNLCFTENILSFVKLSQL